MDSADTLFMSLVILGRQPALGLAELESLYGSKLVRPAGSDAALLFVEPKDVDFDRLGGSIKLAKVLTTLDTTQWGEIESYLVKTTPEHAARLPEGKLTIGLSAYGFRINPASMLATGLTIKKAIKKSDGGRSVRLVPNKDTELNTAQVIHNGLTGDQGWELLIVRDGSQTILAQTVRVQDIESYTIRDRERPKRDARVGMLPPKLAQIIINLAVADTPPSKDIWVLDPFCGTGVVLQEAMLMGFSAGGSDIEPRMTDYTSSNITWLQKMYPETLNCSVAWQLGDATSHQWTSWDGSRESTEEIRDSLVQIKIDAVASETYLGRPFTSLPTPDVLHQTVSDCNLIIKKFLRNIGTQIPSGTRLCLAVPAWQTRPGQFKHLPLIDSLSDMGYNRISFEHVRAEDLLYYRADQIVARELLVLIKK